MDDSGVGGGVTDRLRQIRRNDPDRFAWMHVMPVLFGQRIKNRYYDDTTSFMILDFYSFFIQKERLTKFFRPVAKNILSGEIFLNKI